MPVPAHFLILLGFAVFAVFAAGFAVAIALMVLWIIRRREKEQET